MLKCTSAEFIMILSLLEILFPHLCLFLIINMCSKIHKGYRCVYWFFRLVLDQSMCRRNFGFIFVIFNLICINPFLLARNAFNFCVFNSVVQRSIACCPEVCLLVIRTSSYCWISLLCI
jgi:hypothetical protein